MSHPTSPCNRECTWKSAYEATGVCDMGEMVMGTCMFLILPKTVDDSYMQIENSWNSEYFLHTRGMPQSAPVRPPPTDRPTSGRIGARLGAGPPRGIGSASGHRGPPQDGYPIAKADLGCLLRLTTSVQHPTQPWVCRMRPLCSASTCHAMAGRAPCFSHSAGHARGTLSRACSWARDCNLYERTLGPRRAVRHLDRGE